MSIAITDDMSGQECYFVSKNANDTKTWRGTIDAVGMVYRLAKGYTDIEAYNAAVRQTDATVSSDPTTLKYFIFTIKNTDGSTDTQAFCADWIQDGSFVLTSPQTAYNITVYGAGADQQKVAQDIITTLRLAGYKSFLSSITGSAQ